MSTSLREHVCPNCGAPLGIPEKHDRFFKCPFCGTVLEDHATPKEQETGVFKIKISQEQISEARAARIPVYSAPPTPSIESAPTVTGSTNRLGCVIGIAILMLVGGILAVSLVPALFAGGVISQVIDQVGLEQIAEEAGLEPIGSDSGLGELRLFSFGPVTVLPSDNDTSPDFTGVASGSDSMDHLLYVDFENEPALRWIHPIAGDEASFVYNPFLSDDSRLYYSYGSKIAAYNRAQGTQIWEATAPDKIQHNICPGCFQQIDETILTLTVDGTLSAWNAADGGLNWQTRLAETPRQIVNFGGNPAVLDDIDGQVGLKVFNLADGAVSQRILPACPSEPFPDSPQEVGIYSTMQPLDNGSVLFFGGFFEPGCAIRWDPGQDDYAWLATFDPDISSNIGPENLLLTADTLFIGKGNGAHALDLATGSLSTLVENEDYDVFPVAARDGVVILQMERRRGTRQWELWGVDAALGNVKWTYIPEADDYIERPSFSVDADGAWTAGLTSEGLTVAQLYEEPARIVFQTIPLQSGTASAPVSYTIGGNGMVSFWTSVLGWRNDTFWLLAGSNVLVVDVTTGEGVSAWP